MKEVIISLKKMQFLHRKQGLVGLTRSIPFDIDAQALQAIDLKNDFQHVGVGVPAG